MEIPFIYLIHVIIYIVFPKLHQTVFSPCIVPQMSYRFPTRKCYSHPEKSSRGGGSIAMMGGYFCEPGMRALADLMGLVQQVVGDTEYHINQAQGEVDRAKRTAKILASSSICSAQEACTWGGWVFCGSVITSTLIFTLTLSPLQFSSGRECQQGATWGIFHDPGKDIWVSRGQRRDCRSRLEWTGTVGGVVTPGY